MANLKPDRNLSVAEVFKKLTPALFMAWMITSLLNIMFGYDTTSFGGVQSIPAFEMKFGTPDGKGGFALSPSRASFMSSIAFAGKFVGCMTAPLPIEKLGHRYTMWGLCIIAYVGIILEATSSSVAQFVVGRIIIYYSVGIAEVTAPMYQAELVPAPMRGTVCGSLQLFNQFGQIMAAGVNERFHLATARTGWVIPVVVQVVAPFLASIGLFFIPDGPRWLLSKGRVEDAVRSLERVRPREDREQGFCRAEVEAIQEAMDNQVEKAPWIDLFRVDWTGLCLAIPRFYKTVGLGENAFKYNIASATAGAVGCFMGMIISDTVGRRDLLIVGGFGQALFLFLVAGLGEKKNPSSSDALGLVASVILYIWIFTGTWPPVSYALGPELGTAALREKTMGLGIAVNVISACVVAVAVPFLLNDIGAKIGWLFGGIAVAAAIYAFFFVPETKNRSLEEMDEMFAAHLSTRQFKSFESFGAARRVAELERQTAAELNAAGNDGILRADHVAEPKISEPDAISTTE